MTSAEDYIIRASDAHSWVEVFFPGDGWITFDPTPPSDDHPSGFLAQLGLYWDWFQLQWNDWVVNYDFLHQFTLAQGVQRVSRRWTTSLRESFERSRSAGAKRLRAWADRAGAIPPWMPIVLVPLSIVLLLACNARVRERLVFAFRLKLGFEPPPAQSASFFYQRMLRLLERAGWHKLPSQTPLGIYFLPPGGHAKSVPHLTNCPHGGESIEPSRFADLLSKVNASLRKMSH